jgi:hypothetical protein
LQQLSISTGVAFGALCVELTQHFRGQAELTAADFPPAFIIVALVSLMSVFVFARLSRDAGSELADRVPRGEPVAVEKPTS